MHPWMALWIWSGAMSRVCQDTLSGVAFDPNTLLQPDDETPQATPALICVGDYLKSDVVGRPLQGQLLDRLADLYWTERDSELAI
jgi:hypothetical protein